VAYLLQHLLSESAANYPDHAAILYKNEKITYLQLDQESDQLAQGLLRIGIKKGDRVGIYMNRGISAVTSVFGILKAGATYVPIDPMCPSMRFRYMVNKCNIQFLITLEEKLASIQEIADQNSPVKTVIVMNGLKAGTRSLNSLEWIDWPRVRSGSTEGKRPLSGIDRDSAYILFTSGSTGNPKGVVLSHLNSLTFINAAYDFFQITPTDIFSNICPLHFDMSVFDLFVAFKAGATVVIIPESTVIFPAKLAEVIEHEKISVWNSVPSALSLLSTYRNLSNHDLTSLRYILFAGEKFPLRFLRHLRDLLPGARFCNMYGQTEANTSTYYWVDEIPADDTASLPIGSPLPNFEVFALNETGEQVDQPGQMGEFYVRSSTVALGYWGEPEKTSKAFIRNPLRPDQDEKIYKTGDLVQLNHDGTYLFLGRKDHMIKSRGYRIEIGEIEAVLLNHPEIENAVIIPIPDDLIGQAIAAVIVPRAKSPIGKEEILRFCSNRLPKYMIPEIWEFRNSLPMTSSGKIDRNGLGQMFCFKKIKPVTMDKEEKDFEGTAKSIVPGHSFTAQERLNLS
jgi:amino acid adenylation domain-containing protein